MHMLLTIVTLLDKLVQFPTEIVSLKKKKVPTVCFIGQTIQGYSFYPPEIRDLRHSMCKIWQLLTDSHFDMNLDFFDPRIQSVWRIRLENEDISSTLYFDSKFEKSLVHNNFTIQEVEV